MNLAPLRHHDYRLLFAARSVSLLGTMITYVALPYQIYAMTRSSLSVGLLGLVELIPLLGTALLGGAMADAVDRRRMSLLAEAALAAGSLALVALATWGLASTWVLYAVAAWMSAVRGLQGPSLESLVPRLVPAHELPAAAALTTLTGSVAMISGPAIGGTMIAVIGLPMTYGVDVASYAVSLACLSRMRPVPPATSREPLSVGGIAEGFRYATSRQELIGTYVVDLVAMVFGMPMALFPAIAERLGGSVVLGWLYAAPAVGSLMASVTSGWSKRVRLHGRAIIVAAAIWGIAIVAFGLTRAVVPALLCLMMAGAADAVSGIFRVTLWNQTIPDALRGRLASIEMVSYSSGPLLGHVEAGLVAAQFGVAQSVISGGVLCVVGVLACAWLLPDFNRYRAPLDAPHCTSSGTT